MAIKFSWEEKRPFEVSCWLLSPLLKDALPCPSMCISPVIIDVQVEETLLFEQLQRTLKDQAIMPLVLTSHT